MADRDPIILNLTQKISSLESEVERLKHLLNAAGISYETKTIVNPTTEIISERLTQEHARFFYSMFRGRKDVFSKRGGKVNPKTGKAGYYTQCWNFWKEGVCPKRNGSFKCSDCNNQKFKTLSGEHIIKHLQGERLDGSDVIGVYPMFPDESCHFLVFDFDDHEQEDESWVEDVNAMRAICATNAVPVLVERSRSGNGAHIWMFFEEAIPAVLARRFGSALLTKGAESVSLTNFRSYDRMIPTQDHLPAGGLGNLVALPLQGQALKNGNSTFIDEQWIPYDNQWQKLRETKKIAKAFVEEKTSEWAKDGVLGVFAENIKEEEKPWEKKPLVFSSLDVVAPLKLVYGNQLFVDKTALKPRLQNQIRRLAAYANPEFYKNQALGFSTHALPRIVSCSHEYEQYIGLPRGCSENLLQKLDEVGIHFDIQDERNQGRSIDLEFVAELYPEQAEAAAEMLKHDTGILAAATAFGKTAVGSFLTAKRKVNTLVLVHNVEIMKNWVEDFEKFLRFNEPLPTYQTASGRTRTRKSIVGRLHAGHDSLNGIVDVAMVSSLGKRGAIKDIVKNYGMVIMDECHHSAARTIEDVLNEVNARYVYGLTATPKRDDGQEAKIYMQFGPIRYRYSAKDRAQKQAIDHLVFPRFTRFVHPEGDQLDINQVYKQLRESEVRNQQILADVKDCVQQGRTPLVLTKFKDHAAYLFEQLMSGADHVFLLQGGRSTKERDLIRQQMQAVPSDQSMILIAIGQYIGEGFNYPRLDTMMLTTPIAWQGNVEQYAGRLHRDYDGKESVIIYDYVDTHIRVLDRMYMKRLRAYKKIGYEICLNLSEEKQAHNSIHDHKSYLSVYRDDLNAANKSIIVSSPGLNASKVNAFVVQVRLRQEAGVRVSVLTLAADRYPENRVLSTRQLIARLMEAGIQVITMDSMHEHFAIVDDEVVWYGSMNLLSREKESDNLMRLLSQEIAQELKEIAFGRSV